MLYIELEAHGAQSDVHSGNRGNVVPNPAWALIDLLGTMRAPNGRVLIEGYYDDVRQPTAYELQLADQIPYDRSTFLTAMGLAETPITAPGEYARRIMFEPTFNIAGFHSGYDGEGMKTIIPSTATVKMDLRLVVDQDPDDIFAKVQAHARQHAPSVMVRKLGVMKPSRTSPALPVSQAVVTAVRTARGQEPVVYPSLGGSLPEYVWTKTLGIPAVLVPYANPDLGNHAPNENMELEAYYKGIKTTVHVLDALRRFMVKD